MIDFIDGVLEPFLWFLADWSLCWAVVIIVLASWLAIVRPRRSATRYLLSMLVLVAGLALPLVPRWGPAFVMAPAKVAPQELVPATPVQPSRSSPFEGSFAAEQSTEAPSEIVLVAPHSPPAEQAAPSAEPQPGEHWGLRRTTILSITVIWLLGFGLLSAR